MTRYYKIYDDTLNYINAVGTNCGGFEISEDEYNRIMAVIAEAPAGSETHGYRLRYDLTWEEYELPTDEA